ncbi:unnamed protein product, partial [Rotaria sp. Silwood2]
MQTTAFANIAEISNFGNEEEILFSMNTVFQVGSINQAENREKIWEVRLILTDDNDPQLINLTKRMREETKGPNGWFRMAQLMTTLCDFSQAEQLYNELLKDISSDSGRAHIHHQLGHLKDEQGEYQKAVQYYEKSLEIKQKTLPDDHISLATTYHQLGLAYQNMGDHSKAL